MITNLVWPYASTKARKEIKMFRKGMMDDS
jgi:hypothetical protein